MRIKKPLTEEELKKLSSFFKRYFSSSRIRLFPEGEEEEKEFISFLVEDEEVSSLFEFGCGERFISKMIKIGVKEYLRSLSKEIRKE